MLDNEVVTDQLFLSIWIDPESRTRRLYHFEELLRLFPFSQREQPESVVSIQAIDTTEPPLLERPVNGPIDLSEVVSTFGEYQAEDVGYRLESWWELWQFDEDWKLAPTAVALSCFGPEFDNGTNERATEQEDFRIEFGVDSNYLPRLDVPGSARLTESNIKSLLRLVHEIESSLPVVKRRLETESGENFADRLQQVLSPSGSVQ
jgi:hypothetical protein